MCMGRNEYIDNWSWSIRIHQFYTDYYSGPIYWWFGKVNQTISTRNFLRNTIRKFSAFTNTIIDCRGAPYCICLLSLMYVWLILNYKYHDSINGIPITKATGSTLDISPLLCVRFWQPVYYKVYEYDLQSYITEQCGSWVDIAENVAHYITLKVITDDT